MSIDSVAEAVSEIARANDGRLTPEMVVEAARDKNSPLHQHFTWDDADAANKRRIDEARVLIRSVKIEFRVQTFQVQAPAFVRDPDAGQNSGYVSIGKLRDDIDMAREVIVTEFARAAAALKRARAVAASLGLEGEIADLEERVGMVMSSVTPKAASLQAATAA